MQMAVAQYRDLDERIAEAERALDRLSAADKYTRLLLSIPGVGPRTAEVIAAHLGDATRFASGKHAGAYAGLVPTQYQKGRITRRGPAVLREPLVECAWCMLRYNPWAKAQYARLTGGRRELQEVGHRGPGAETVGAVLGHATGREGVARGPGARCGRDESVAGSG